MNLTGREAGRLVKTGQGLQRFPIVRTAALAGAVLAGQAEAISGVLGQLPAGFDDHTIAEAQQLMVNFAGNKLAGSPT